jgi:hypothetical protein
MTNQLLISAGNQNGIGSGFMAVVGGGQWTGSPSLAQQITMKIGATFSNQSAEFIGGLVNGTLTFRINAVNGNQVCVGQTGRITDTTHSDTAVAGNLVDYTYTTGFASVTHINVQMNTVTPYTLQGSGAGSGTPSMNFSTTPRYTTAMGGNGGGSPQLSPNFACQQGIEQSGTVSQFAIFITGSSSGTITVNLNKNGSTANSTLSPGSGTTGLVVDVTHTDSCAAGDLLCVAFSSTNASGNMSSWTFSFVGATSAMDGTCSAAGTNTLASTPAYFPFGGSMSDTTAQSDAQAYASYALTAKLLRVTWSNVTTSATAVFQNGGVAGNMTVSWSGTSGIVVDSTHTDSVSPTNLIGGAVTSGSSININSIGFGPDDGSISGAHPTSQGGMHG